MNTTIQDGVTISTGDFGVTVDGVLVENSEKLPGINITIINNKVYIDGFELVEVEGKKAFKWTPKAFWHNLF